MFQKYKELSIEGHQRLDEMVYHAGKKGGTKPKRAPNKFIVFQSSIRPALTKKIKKENPNMTSSEINKQFFKQSGDKWKEMTESEKAKY